MNQDEIHIFLQNYDDAVNKGDSKAIASCFHDQFTLTTATELWHITNNEEFRSNLTKSFARYKKLGAKKCKMLSRDIINFNSHHVIANVEWGLIDHNNLPIVKFDISYCIKRIGDGYKYIFVIDHNENERLIQYQQQKLS